MLELHNWILWMVKNELGSTNSAGPNSWTLMGEEAFFNMFLTSEYPRIEGRQSMFCENNRSGHSEELVLSTKAEFHKNQTLMLEQHQSFALTCGHPSISFTKKQF